MIFTCRFLFKHAFSFHLSKYLKMELLVVHKYMCAFIRNCQTVFQSSYTILHSHQQYMRVSFAPGPLQHLVLLVVVVVCGISLKF